MENNIAQYQSAILPQFAEVITLLNERGENSFYYKPYVYDWEKEWNKDIKSHPNYDQVDKDLIAEFIKQQTFVILNTTKLFKFVYRYKEPNPSLSVKISLAQGDVERNLNGIGYYENQLKHRVRQKEHSLALDVQDDLLLIFQESLSILKSNCQINVLKSPLGINFIEAEERIRKAVDIKKIDILLKLREDKPISGRPEATALPRNKDYKDKIWFKVGLLFATGEMKQLAKDLDNNATQIAESLEEPGFNKYILATLNDYQKSNKDKNIYASRMKMQLIIDHCRENDIEIDMDFLNSIPSE